MKIGVRVPASSANMGAGFDTLGVALNLYSRLEIEEIDGGLDITTINPTGAVADDKSNLVYRAMDVVFKEVGYEPCGVRIVQKSDIPMTRGLGSSSACIIGGMLAANVMSGKKLTYERILELAAAMEGHPDNVTPALYGGFCVAAMDGERVWNKSIKLDNRLRFAVMIPDFFLATRKSRTALPSEVDFRTAVHNISAVSILQAALTSGDYELLRYGVSDMMHQPYRKGYIDGFDDILKKTYEEGAAATYLSGSGPTILSILTDDGDRFKQDMEKFFSENEHKWTCKILECDNVGSVVSISE